MITIKIPTLTDFYIWSNKKASEYDNENRQRVDTVKAKILLHINREPIPKENRVYLSEMVSEEFNKLSLKRCVWPIKNKK